MAKEISRRDFMKGIAAGAVSMSAIGLVNKSAFAEEPAEKIIPAKTLAAESTTVMSPLNPQDYSFKDGQSDLSNVFSGWKLGNMEFTHRMVKSAAGSDTCGKLEESVAYYSAFAKGGVEMVWVEDFAEWQTYFPTGRGKKLEEAYLKEITDGIHANGGKCGYQLSCMGRSFSGFDAAHAAQYASACAHDMTLEEVKQLQEDFISGAVIMKEAGFDAVEINAAGNNIGQAFFSRQRNHREDEYGPQSFENRARFVGEIIKGIKERCGEDFPVQVLFNGIEENDIDIGEATLSTTVEENCLLCKALEEFGANSLHVRLGVFRMHVNQFMSDLYFTGRGIVGTSANGTRFDFSRHFQGKVDGTHDGYGMMLNVAAEIKKAVTIPVGVVTGMNPAIAPKFFDDAIKNGMCDFFLMTRPLTVDPEYVNKLREGRVDEIAPCCRCAHCHFDYAEDGKTYEHCRVNAATQRAYREAMPEGAEPLPCEKAKKIMVIGAGPAGMEAARIAAQRGHDVTLYEKSVQPGGLLNFADYVKGPHENIGGLRKYLIRQQELKGVTVVTGKEVTKDFIESEKPDAVILAVGGKRPELEFESTAGTNVITAEEVLTATVGQKVTILGGNVQAVDIAQYLISLGKHVTMVSPEPKEKLDKGQSSWVKQFTIPMLYANGTRLWENASLKSVGDGSVVILGETGCDMTIACDTVIDVRDMLPNKDLIEGLSMPAVAVGDCDAPFNIAEAIWAGNKAARYSID